MSDGAAQCSQKRTRREDGVDMVCEVVISAEVETE